MIENITFLLFFYYLDYIFQKRTKKLKCEKFNLIK